MTHKERYMKAAHRVQTAIGFMPDHPNQTHKGMRTGIDLSKSDMMGLATLLIDKGIITLEEYEEAIANSAEKEADDYEKELSSRMSAPVKTL